MVKQDISKTNNFYISFKSTLGLFYKLNLQDLNKINLLVNFDGNFNKEQMNDAIKDFDITIKKEQYLKNLYFLKTIKLYIIMK